MLQSFELNKTSGPIKSNLNLNAVKNWTYRMCL